MKIRELHIEDYKMFKDFSIDFVGNDDKALPIVVLAGVNGSGKTTLLESLVDNKLSNVKIEFNKNDEIIVKSFSDENWKKNYKKATLENLQPLDEMFNTIDFLKNTKDNIIYFPAGEDKTKNVANEFVKTFYDFLKNEDYRPSEVREHFNEYMHQILGDLDVGFKYSHLDRDDNVWFVNDAGEEFEIKDLSTGEKTILSKVIYLYFLGYKDKIILIDEPELSLHPSWQNRVLKIYESYALKNNCQIILATHSPQIIASAKNEYIRVLRKNSNGNIEAVKVNNAEGRDINSILFDVMGEVEYRPKEFVDKIDRLFIEIDNKNLDNAKKLLNDLKKSYGEKDATVIEAQMLIDMYENE